MSSRSDRRHEASASNAYGDPILGVLDALGAFGSVATTVALLWIYPWPLGFASLAISIGLGAWRWLPRRRG